jgi:hypothetical protein
MIRSVLLRLLGCLFLILYQTSAIPFDSSSVEKYLQNKEDLMAAHQASTDLINVTKASIESNNPRTAFKAAALGLNLFPHHGTIIQLYKTSESLYLKLLKDMDSSSEYSCDSIHVLVKEYTQVSIDGMSALKLDRCPSIKPILSKTSDPFIRLTNLKLTNEVKPKLDVSYVTSLKSLLQELKVVYTPLRVESKLVFFKEEVFYKDLSLVHRSGDVVVASRHRISYVDFCGVVQKLYEAPLEYSESLACGCHGGAVPLCTAYISVPKRKHKNINNLTVNFIPKKIPVNLVYYYVDGSNRSTDHILSVPLGADLTKFNISPIYQADYDVSTEVYPYIQALTLTSEDLGQNNATKLLKIEVTVDLARFDSFYEGVYYALD